MSWNDPTLTQLAAWMSEFTGRHVSAAAAEGKIRLNEGPGYIATYTDAASSIVGLCRCDIAGAASLGAALTLLPPARVENSVRYGTLDELLLENFAEVCNVMSRAFTAAALPSVTLGKIHEAPVAAIDAGVEPEQDGKARLDIHIDVLGYTNGEMTLLRL